MELEIELIYNEKLIQYVVTAQSMMLKTKVTVIWQEDTSRMQFWIPLPLSPGQSEVDRNQIWPPLSYRTGDFRYSVIVIISQVTQ